MNNPLKLKFVEYKIKSFFDTCLGIINQGAKKILLRPFNHFASGLVNKVTANNLAVTFYAIENELEVSLNKNVKLSTSNALFDASILVAPDEKNLSSRLMEYIDLKQGVIIAPITPHYYKKNPVFLISIPKGGTHLLYRISEIFGYRPGISFNDQTVPGHWYCLEHSNSHTSAKDFFIDSVRRNPFGNRLHPFPSSPAIFIYRNPLDIIVSEANYYHIEGKTLFHGYLSNRSFEERLLTLIDDPWLLGSIRDRIGNFLPWLEFQNVIPISFEELVGTAGGGSEKAQIKLIWSLQLKLHIPGSPKSFAKKVFDENSPTFHKGQISSFKKYFTEKAYRKFNDLPQDFMTYLGYTADFKDNAPVLPRRIDEFRKRPLILSKNNFDDTPVAMENNFFGHNIVKYKKRFYVIPQYLGPIDLTDEKSSVLKRLKAEKSLDAAKQQIIFSQKNVSLNLLWSACKRKLRQLFNEK